MIFVSLPAEAIFPSDNFIILVIELLCAFTVWILAKSSLFILYIIITLSPPESKKPLFVRTNALTLDLWSFNILTLLNKAFFSSFSFFSSSHILIVLSSLPDANLLPINSHKEYIPSLCSSITWVQRIEFSEISKKILQRWRQADRNNKFLWKAD